MRPVVFPPPLKKTSRLAVVAPASPPDPEALENGIQIIKRRYEVIAAENLHAGHGYLAGDDAVRTRAFQRALDDESAGAILAGRGGYGTSRILDRLDFRRFEKFPKWVAGSSDLTALAVHLLATRGIASIHGPMVAGFTRTHEADVKTLFDLLSGAASASDETLSAVSPGHAEGPLIGGNLTVLAHMAGTLPKGFLAGAIVFFEDVGEKPYRLDRCLTQLRRSGMLDDIAGVVLGEFTNCDPNPDGTTVLNVMTEFVKQAQIPAATGYPAAHGTRNKPFIQGASAVLDSGKEDATLSFRDRVRVPG